MANYSSVGSSPLRAFIERYFEAWQGGAPEKVLDFFSEDAVINLWGGAGTLAGKRMVAEQWVNPTVMNFPANIHHVRTFLEADDQVVVEWLFTGAHVSSGKEINVQGCSIYWVSGGLIRRGNVYFNSAPPKREQGLPASDPAYRSDRLGQAGQAPANL